MALLPIFVVFVVIVVYYIYDGDLDDKLDEFFELNSWREVLFWKRRGEERDILLTRSREIDIWSESSRLRSLSPSRNDAKRPLDISLRAIPPVIGNHSLQPLPPPARTSVEITLGRWIWRFRERERERDTILLRKIPFIGY